jgi:ligand-binding SRPBCC domain-containing protein
MKIYTLHTKQKLPVSVDKAWDFLSDPRNLKTITPDYMGFEILSGADRPMYPGQLIQYIVTPVAGIKTKWLTEITHVKEKEYFVDEQRYGPYALWHHKHFIKPIKGGVEMEDIVDYKLPFGILGRLAQPLLVATRLEEIFRHRRIRLNALFGEYSSSSQIPSSTLKEDILN